MLCSATPLSCRSVVAMQVRCCAQLRHLRAGQWQPCRSDAVLSYATFLQVSGSHAGQMPCSATPPSCRSVAAMQVRCCAQLRHLRAGQWQPCRSDAVLSYATFVQISGSHASQMPCSATPPSCRSVAVISNTTFVQVRYCDQQHNLRAGQML